MGQRSFIGLAAFRRPVRRAVGLYVYDTARDDTIAEGITVAGVDLGGIDADEARTRSRRRWRGRSSARSRSPTAKRFNLSAEDAGVKADVGGMVDAALARSRDGILRPRRPRHHRRPGGGICRRPSSRYSQPAVEKLVDRVATASTGPRATRRSTSSLARVKERERTAPGEAARSCGGRSRPSSSRRRTARARARRGDEAEGHAARARGASTRTCSSSTAAASGSRYYGHLKLDEDLPDRGRPGRARDARRAATTSRTRRSNPSWHVPNSAWAGEPRGHGRPAGPVEPDQGALDGDLRRRRASTAPTTSARSARPRSHGCIRMAIPDVVELYDQVPVGDPDLHRLARSAPISSTGTSSQPLLEQRGMPPGVSNAERADEDTPLPLSHHRVPQRRRVAVGPWIGCHGAAAAPSRSTRPGLHQLPRVATRPV